MPRTNNSVSLRQRLIPLIIGLAVLGLAIFWSEIETGDSSHPIINDISTDLYASGDADLFAGLRVRFECWFAPNTGRVYGCRSLP